MKSFLCKNKRPIVKWTKVPHGVFYQGSVPDGYSLAVCPSPGTIIVDVDRHGDKDGFLHIPQELKEELSETFNYPTKNNGQHYWFNYSGLKILANKPGGCGIDLRTHKGYVIWYSEYDIKDLVWEDPSNTKGLSVNKTSEKMNAWLEGLFASKTMN